MNPQWIATGIFLLLFLAIIVAAHVMYKASVDTEQSRKFVHVAGGVLSLFLPAYIHDHWYVLGLCSLAFLTLLVTWIRKDLPGIHKTKRKSVGSVIFPVPVYICFVVAGFMNNELLFYYPVLLLTFSDTIAEWGGKRWGKNTVGFFGGRKTLAGSLCFFVSAVIIMLAWSIFFNKMQIKEIGSLQLILFFATAGTIAELISMNGWDNLTVPVTVMGAILILM